MTLPLRVLHVIGGLSDRSGGPTTALSGLACGQARAGAHVQVAVGQRSEEPFSRAAEFQAAGIRIDVASRGSISDAVRNSDIVHLHGVWEPILHAAADAARAAGIPYLFRSCGMLDEWALSRKWLKKRLFLAFRLRRLLDGAAAIHCTSAAEATSTAQLRLKPPLVVAPNGIILDEFRVLPEAGGFRNRHHVGNHPLVVFLGRVHPGKGVEYLLPAVARMRRKDAIVAIVGPADSAFGQDMRTLAASLGIGERVVFTGLLRGHERLRPLVDADLFCLPSEHENFGVAVVEALAAGCPTIVSEHVGLADEIRRHRLGDVTTLAAESIAEALDRWLDNEAERLSARTAARRHALATYDWTAIAAIWLNEYTAILSRLPHTRDSRTLASSHSERLAAATTGATP